MRNKISVLTGLLVGFAICLAAQENPKPPVSLPPPAAASPEPADSVSIQQDVEYGVQGGEKLLLDVYQPAEPGSKPRPVVVPVSLVMLDDGHTFRSPEARRRLVFETLAFFNQYLDGDR